MRFRSSAPLSLPASVSCSSRSVTAVMERMPVQRSMDTNARVRSSACSSSATGLRDRYASSHVIEVGCKGCAARQWSANCPPLVEPRYSTSFFLPVLLEQVKLVRLARAPRALSLDRVAGRHLSRVSRLRSSSSDCSTREGKVNRKASKASSRWEVRGLCQLCVRCTLAVRIGGKPGLW
jgi:hypothetical protein